MSKYPCMTHLILVNASMRNYTKNKDCSYYYQNIINPLAGDFYS